MDKEAVESLLSPDGQRRVDIYRRADGLFGFDVPKRHDGPANTREYWAPLGPFGTITATAESAKREAYSRVPWLQRISN
jgi:hypothetical protein